MTANKDGSKATTSKKPSRRKKASTRRGKNDPPIIQLHLEGKLKHGYTQGCTGRTGKEKSCRRGYLAHDQKQTASAWLWSKRFYQLSIRLSISTAVSSPCFRHRRLRLCCTLCVRGRRFGRGAHQQDHKDHQGVCPRYSRHFSHRIER